MSFLLNDRVQIEGTNLSGRIIGYVMSPDGKQKHIVVKQDNGLHAEVDESDLKKINE